MLNQAGVSGFEMDLLPLVIFPEIDTYVQIYQSDLAKIGIAANILHLDFATWLDQVNNVKYHGMYASSDGRAQLTPLTYSDGKRSGQPVQEQRRLQERRAGSADRPARRRARPCGPEIAA